MDPVEIINAELPEGRRPITSLSNPGDLSPHVLNILADKIPPEEIVETIQGMIRATRQTKYGEEPDARAREAGVKLWMAYKVGLPIQRIETKNENKVNDGEALMRVLESPTLLANVEAILAAAKAKAVSEKQA